MNDKLIVENTNNNLHVPPITIILTTVNNNNNHQGNNNGGNGHSEQSYTHEELAECANRYPHLPGHQLIQNGGKDLADICYNQPSGSVMVKGSPSGSVMVKGSPLVV